jgi:hypothetical protein
MAPEEYDDFNQEAEDEGAAFGSMDFNVDDEYKPDPLIPKGTYHGVITKVQPKFAKFTLVWHANLHDNGGVMNDGETSIDGATVYFNNWLPKPGDEKLMTASGKNTKRQSKINTLKQFQEELGIDMSTPQVIATALSEAQWVGIEVSVEVDVEEWNGRFRNVVNRMKKSTLYASDAGRTTVDRDVPF